MAIGNGAMYYTLLEFEEGTNSWNQLPGCCPFARQRFKVHRPASAPVGLQGFVRVVRQEDRPIRVVICAANATNMHRAAWTQEKKTGVLVFVRALFQDGPPQQRAAEHPR